MTELFKMVKEVIDYSNDMDCKVSKLEAGWKEGKKKFIKEFGENLIIESSSVLTIDKPEEDKIIEYRDYVDSISYETANEELRYFLIDQGWTAFYNNITRESFNKFKFNIPKGMKINRALKFFIKNKSDLDYWQSAYSRLIQDIKISGRLCLSVHPLDYLSISETTHHWRSCHSLNGEYRAGNLSYMQDSSTVVAYLKSEGEYTLPSFPESVQWNSKKWRVLLYVNENRDLIFSSKPYPFNNSDLVNASYDMLQQTFGGVWPKDSGCLDSDEILDYLSDSPGAIHFNDCLCSVVFSPKYKSRNGNESYKNCAPIEVGCPVWCLDCEDEVIEFGADYTCIDCGDYIACESCGCHMYEDESYYVDKQHLCPECYDDIIIWCDSCGKSYSRENPEMVYDDINDLWQCPKCYDIMIESPV